MDEPYIEALKRIRDYLKEIGSDAGMEDPKERRRDVETSMIRKPPREPKGEGEPWPRKR